MRWKSKKSMEIISNAHACTREWTHEKSWHRENLPPSWNHPVSSISLYPTPLRKKKKKNERCRIHERIRVVILVNHENDEEPNARKLGPCNWKSDWRFSFSSFLRLHSFCHSFSSLLTRILTSKENFISRFKRNIRNLYIHEQAN